MAKRGKMHPASFMASVALEAMKELAPSTIMKDTAAVIMLKTTLSDEFLFVSTWRDWMLVLISDSSSPS